jgi:phosphomannomutase
LVRFSGTEPLVRVYAEADSAELRDAILDEGAALVRGDAT